MRLRKSGPALILSFALLAAAPAAAERLTIEPTGHPVVPVTVNGAGPFDFVIDTCASASMVLAGLRERLGLQPLPNVHGALHGASGNGSASLYRLDSMVVDGRASGPVTAASMNGAPSEHPPSWSGIVGADILSRYVVEFDGPGGAFHLLDPATDLAAHAGWTAIPVQLNRVRFPTLPGTIDGAPVQILFDTGARRTLINWAAARQLGIAPGDPTLSAAEPVRGATAQRTDAVKRTFRSITIGGLTIPAGEVVIADLPVFGTLGWSGPALILGMDRMRAYRFAVDYPRSRLLVAQATAR
jgi:predicted aspartyl protease